MADKPSKKPMPMKSDAMPQHKRMAMGQDVVPSSGRKVPRTPA